MCGEKHPQLLDLARRGGSPPRVRGKDRNFSVSGVSIGITPACAGKSSGTARCRAKTQDHPRVCGEKAPTKCGVKKPLGSPPRVRGKVVDDYQQDFRTRITPACAGKSLISTPLLLAIGDHPRVCGEKYTHALRMFGNAGSPPRVRGKEYLDFKDEVCIRITPACAGKRKRGSADER